MDPNEYHFTVFKGLQRPLEFMGLRGRFLVLAGAGIGISLLGAIICMVLIGQIVALIFLFVSSILSFLTLYLKQKQGLYNKKKCNDILVYQNIFIR